MLYYLNVIYVIEFIVVVIINVRLNLGIERCLLNVFCMVVCNWRMFVRCFWLVRILLDLICCVMKIVFGVRIYFKSLCLKRNFCI